MRIERPFFVSRSVRRRISKEEEEAATGHNRRSPWSVVLFRPCTQRSCGPAQDPAKQHTATASQQPQKANERAAGRL